MDKYQPLQQLSKQTSNVIVSAAQLFTEILISSGATSNAIAFSDADFEIIEFQLGLPLVATPDTPDNEHPPDDLYVDDLYLVGQGRIRLLGFDEELNRDLTLRILNVGTWFGAESILSTHSWNPYQAIGSSPGMVYRLPNRTLTQWLKHCSSLRDYLSAPITEYQRVAFFRTASSLRDYSGPQIRALAAKTTDRLIPPQTRLADYAQDQQGVFWLRSGEIQSQRSHPPQPGEGWRGGPQIPPDWLAKTELSVYYLPVEACESPELTYLPLVTSHQYNPDAPLTRGSAHQSHQTNNGQNRSNTHKRATGKYKPATSKRATSKPSHPSSLDQPALSEVIFPKPLHRKVLDRFNRFPWIEQQSSSDCGAACLAMIARYWGKHLPINTLRELANVGRSGASLKNLARGAERLGFHTRPVRASLGRIAEQSNPWIAHWQGNHYVVVYKVGKKRVILADPALGKRSISTDDFKTHWTGYALLLETTEAFKDVEFKKASLGRYLRLLVPYQSLIFQIILLSVIIQLFSLVTPLFTQIILDKVVVHKSMVTLNVFTLGLFMFGFWGIALSAVRSYLLTYFSMRLDLTMVSGFIKHAISLPLKFYESRRVGDILTRVQENQKIQQFLIGQVMLAWLGFLTGFVYLGLMLYYNLQLTLIVLMLMPPIVIITLVATPFLQQISRNVFKEAENQNSTLVEMMSGIATVKAAGVEQEVRWRWEDSLIQLKNVAFNGQKFGIGLGVVNGSVSTLGSTALLWVGASMVIQDKLSIGQFVAFNMMISYVLSPVVALANLWDELQEIFISMERLNDVFETKPEESPNQPMLMLPPIVGNVELEEVTFRYNEDADQNTLANLSFQVEAGQTIAIVGRSGSGKSTLVKLLEGLYHPTKGRIFIDGHDIRHVSPSSLRTQLGVVPQECFLFSGTILENITLYRHDFSLAQAVEAAKLAEAHAFIQALPLGYNTKVGERGSTLSGGQRQRIAIARALLGDPRVLILDEATSSLDTESERRFQRNLAQISRDRTTFIIAHRLSTVRNADCILVLDKGILVEQGTHEQLITAQGIYHNLAQQQLDL